MAQQWYSIVEYARAFSISDMTVRRRIKTGKLNAVLRDGKYFIPVDGREPAMASPKEAMPQMTRPSNGNIPNHLSYSQPNENYTTPSKNIRMNESPQTSFHNEKVIARNIPNSITRPIAQSESLVMRADQLIKFCDKTVGEFQQMKTAHKDLYESKIKALEARLNTKEVELQQYRQQVEDLQVLVKILESKKTT